MKDNLWKKVRNAGLVLTLAGALFAEYQFYDAKKNNNDKLNQTHAKKVGYGLGSMLVGSCLVIGGGYKLVINEVEEELKNE